MRQKLLFEAIQSYLEETRTTRPQYSLRALAKRLQVGPGALSEFLRGKRTLSPEVSLRIANLLPMPDLRREKLLEALHQAQSKERVKLDAEQFSKISHWSAAALMCLFELENPPDSLEEIARRLQIPQDQIQNKMNQLLDVGLLSENKGKVTARGLSVTTTEDIPSVEIQKFHDESLQLSRRALAELPPDQREFTSLTFSSSAEKLSAMKQEIRKFRERFAEKSATTTRDEVFQLQISFFPLTRWEKNLS